MIEIKKITTTKTGNCTNCGRDVKPNWEAYYDYESKELYCRPCGERLVNSVDSKAEKSTLKKEDYGGISLSEAITECVDRNASMINENILVLVMDMNRVVNALIDVQMAVNDLSKYLKKVFENEVKTEPKDTKKTTKKVDKKIA